ncbi:MAG TPA: ABC transporter permease [Solirubrobacteraceae bacterium]|jgi:spermidine/putrescine transport system permease protein|nr:ABC transporter permease [Solirubrobacteraceae bacterium]
MSRRLLSKVGIGAGIAAIMVFLFAPAVVVALYSFNKSSIMGWPPDPGTLSWYSKVFANEAMMEGLENSAIVAIVSVAIAIALGLPAGLGIARYEFWGKTTFQRILMMPFVLPGLIGGLTLLTVILDFQFELSLETVIIAHATMLIAVVVIQMAVVMARWDHSLEEAAGDLGANEIRTFIHVTWPNIKPAIFGAALLGVAVSLEETARTTFVVGEQDTLPIVVLSGLRRTLTPQINAIGTVVLLFSLVAIGFWSKFGAADLARS